MDNQVFFENARAFGDWLKKNHLQEKVLWLCYYKKHTKKPSITWDESVAEALCYGWIDGLRKSIDDESYKIRFTPRKKNSIWSRKNIETVGRLMKEKRMLAEGLQAFEYRKEHKSAVYGYEKENLKLLTSYTNALTKDADAWKYYSSMSLSIKKQTINWIMSAKKQETRDRRFAKLIERCRANEVVPPLLWTKKKK